MTRRPPSDSDAFAEPPEGAIRGESVPRESEPDERIEALIEYVENELKTHDQYRLLSASARREAAKRIIRSNGVDL